jgi:hypothetical protein
MQCVGFVPEMSHFVVRRERIFVDQLEIKSTDEITITRTEYKAIQNDIATLTRELKKLQLKVDKMDKK